jgi:hypothetical protein
MSDTVKRHWRIAIHGWGGEIVFDPSTEEEYEYWNSDQPYIDMDIDPAEEESALAYYVWENSCEPGMFPNVPDQFQNDNNWFDRDTLLHINGADFESAYITIEEVNGDDWDADPIAELVENMGLGDYAEQNSVAFEQVDFEPDEEYLFHGFSEEKGTFFNGIVSTDGEFNPYKLSFVITNTPVGYSIVSEVKYDGEFVENSLGSDTDGKGMTIEIISN